MSVYVPIITVLTQDVLAHYQCMSGILQVLYMGYITCMCTYDYRFYVWDILHACVRMITGFTYGIYYTRVYVR